MMEGLVENLEGFSLEILVGALVILLIALGLSLIAAWYVATTRR